MNVRNSCKNYMKLDVTSMNNCHEDITGSSAA